MQNYEEYKAYCEMYGKKPKIKHNIRVTKDGEQETEEQKAYRLANSRNKFYSKKELTEEEKIIKRLYEELDKKYGQKQPAINIARAVAKEVKIDNSQAASQFLISITNTNERKGA